jgi:hypothetical protein
MGGFLDRKLLKRERNDGNGAFDLEDDIRPLEVSFHKDYFVKVYLCSEEMPIPWNADPQKGLSILAAGQPMIVFIRARDGDDMVLHLESDLDLAAQLVDTLGGNANNIKVFILVPRDFEDLPPQKQEFYIKAARTDKFGIMICPETTVSLDTDAARRISSSRIIRE